MLRALPLLASRDLSATDEFYRRLGFTNRGAPHAEWDYLIIEYDGGELHFAGPLLGERTPGASFIYADDLDGVYADWTSRADAAARFTPCTFTNFGMRMFSVFDLFDNEIRVGWPPR
jgi:hypothetical protein